MWIKTAKGALINTDNLVVIYLLDFEDKFGGVRYTIEAVSSRGSVNRVIYDGGDDSVERDYVFREITTALARGTKMIDIANL